MLRPVRLERVSDVPDESLQEARVNGAIEGFGNRLDGVASFVTKLQKDIEALQQTTGERETVRLQIKRLEDEMDNLPARVSDLEKYGSEHTIQLEPRVNKLEEKLQRLAKRPKKKRAAEQRRQNRALMIAGVISAGAVVLSLGCSAIGLGVSIWLANH